MIDFSRIEAITFDCFGTLIDWETGILQAIHPVLAVHGVRADDEQVLSLYADLERRLESEASTDRRKGFTCYKEVLRGVMHGIAAHFGFSLIEREADRLPLSLARWPAFDDTAPVLKALSTRYRLAVLSNVDADLFEGVAPKLGVTLDELVTAEYCRSYKPDPRHFRVALALLDLPPDRVLHVAESLVHDVGPANALGIPTVWINRRGPKGPGASGGPKASSPVPVLEVPTLRALAERLNVAVGAPG